MPNWKLEIEYEGTRYRGWQMQHNAKTVQGELLKVSRQLFKEKARIIGAGRTDAGVHALGQAAHLKVSKLEQNVTPRMIRHGFNDQLPRDINILQVRNAPENFHALRDAVARQYLYQISTRRTAFAKNLVWWIRDELDVLKMQEACEKLIGRHDFSSFCQLDETKNPTTEIEIEHAEIFPIDDMICFRIKSSHFLWKMVRRLVGTLAEVGRGNYSPADLQRMLKFKSNAPAEFTAPPSGLFLEKVFYP